MKAKISAAVALAIMTATTVHAQNRQDSDAIFTEPAKAGWTQIFLGFVELIAAGKVYPGLESEIKSLKSAELNLTMAQEAITSERQRERAIQAILDNKENYEFGEVDPDDLKSSASKRIERLKSGSVMTAEAKTAAIEAAKVEVASARQVAVEAAQNKGILQKGIKGLRIVGSTLLVADVVGRIYVWNALDANPTISPGAAYIQHLIKK